MAGLVVMPINRVPTSTITLDAGTIVAAYPLANLKSPRKDLETRATPSLSIVRFAIDLGAAPVSTADTSRLINSFFVSGTIDGTTIDVYYGTTNVFGSASLAFQKVMDGGCNDADMLWTFSGGAYRYWWVEFVNTPATMIVRAMSLGPHIDLGAPMRPRNMAFVEQDPALRLLGGYVYPGRLDAPIIRREYTLQDTGSMTSTNVYDNTKHATLAFRAYNTLVQAFAAPYQIELSSGSYNRCGLMTPGGSVPIPFREPDAVGYSSAGRPAFYGYPTLTLSKDIYRAISLASISFEEVNPRGPDIRPVTN